MNLQEELNQISSLTDLKNKYIDRLPKHVGLVLDGNRRWIKKQGLKDVTQGHLAGYQRLKRILYPFFEAGIHYLSAYALSIENVQKRSKEEVQFLFKLLLKGVEDVLNEPLIHEKKVRVRLIGRIGDLPPEIQSAIAQVNEKTAYYNENFINFCVMYDGQEEIVDAVKSIVKSGIEPAAITKSIIKSHLYTYDFPELDYMIRTGMDDGARISGFLLWDASYAEFRFRSDLWPDYDESMILDDLKEYIRRDRRKGK
jgi:undecaprenyl diphosphate synthase